MASKEELKRYRSNLSNELHSAALYETLAKVQKDVTRKGVFAELTCVRCALPGFSRPHYSIRPKRLSLCLNWWNSAAATCRPTTTSRRMVLALCHSPIAAPIEP